MHAKLKNLLPLKSLIILGFMTAVVPLFLGVVYAAYGLRETAELGRTINSQVFEQTKTIRLVLQKASDIERKARLFVLLSDPALRQPYERESYEAARATFKQALHDLLKLHVDNKIALLANELSEKENLIYQQIIGSESEDTLRLPLDEAFLGLREASNTLSREFENHVEHTFNELHQLSEAWEQGLLTKGAILLLLSGAFVITLLAILSRSMEQLHSSIRRLGAGELTEPVEVTGPADLRLLGERLESLRTHLLNVETSKQHLMKNIAREIELPLQAISDDARRLSVSKGQAPMNSQDVIAQQLETSAVKLKAVSEQLLRYSQFKSQQDSKQSERIDIKNLLESKLDGLQERIAAKAIKVKKLIKPVQVNGIYDQIQEIIEQLLTNAIRYSPTEGEIRILLRDTGNQMELEIEDDGPGIPVEEREQIFEPFYRGNSTMARELEAEPKLGLAMVREYVHHHQGMIKVIDARLDHPGNRIRVQLPLNIDA